MSQNNNVDQAAGALSATQVSNAVTDGIGYVRVACVWETDDVREVAEDLDDDQAAAVLLLACVSEHDAELGVNWDVLGQWADYVRNNPDVVARVIGAYGARLITDEAAA